MSTERLAAAIQFFFETALPEATGKRLSDLADAAVHVGGYERYAGAALTTRLGQAITPKYVLKVGKQPLQVGSGAPALASLGVGADATAEPLLWVRRLADAVTDNEAELLAVLSDLDTFARIDAFPSSEGAAKATPHPAANASAWARALGGMSEAARRAAFGSGLSGITAVPEPLRSLAPDVAALSSLLAHFFTYREDGSYYAKWSGAGRKLDAAADLTPDYKRENVRELELDRHGVYLHGIVPEGLFGAPLLVASTAPAPAGTQPFREFVIRFDETGNEAAPLALSTVHSVRCRLAAGTHHDFTFFFAADGAGLPYSAEVVRKLTTRLQRELTEAPAPILLPAALGAPRPAAQGRAAAVSPDSSELLHLIAEVDGEPSWPEGVLSSGAERFRSMLVPRNKLAEVGAMSEVKRLTHVDRYTPSLGDARALVNYPGLDAKIAAAQRGGQGVLIGIIDSGIDGSHKAFAGRILAVWDQLDASATPAQSPKARHPGDAGYNEFAWGREYQGAETSGSRDPGGHGTHVSGICAGAELKDAAGNVTCPAGLAPKARLVVVSAIGGSGGDPVLAIRYIFKKAEELAKSEGRDIVPCVINMSFESHYHGHDGLGGEAHAMFNQIYSGGYKPGRILVAAAGNQRGSDMHVMRTIPAKGGANFQLRLDQKLPPGMIGTDTWMQIWIKNPLGKCPTSFPLALWMWRNDQPWVSTKAVVAGAAASIVGVFAAANMKVQASSSLANVNGDFDFTVGFIPLNPATGLAKATWNILLRNESSHALDVHAWLSIPNGDSAFVTTPAEDSFLVGRPADSPGVIGIGSCTSRNRWRPEGATADLQVTAALGEISSFSSPGPLRTASIALSSPAGYPITHEVRGVDTTGPGELVQSARSAQYAAPPKLAVNSDSVMMQGTSMASPAVTGLIANVLSQEPRLTALDVLTRLKESSAIPATSAHKPPPSSSGPAYSALWGYGLIKAPDLKRP